MDYAVKRVALSQMLLVQNLVHPTKCTCAVAKTDIRLNKVDMT